MTSEFFPCCNHCECPIDAREGHDDTCRYGCNDTQADIITTRAIGAGGLKQPEKKGFK
ncbi:hypothetical protein SEA_CIRCINUS_65 [Streptomyces phage Circinus]|uniref:Uncharacterized protein n=1 Tax=Streptomyces phage Circinus TaxID=2562189 RepID=A0A4D6E104_9CAUD|nr:hypothetical protein SEA_CIRCINUS_65 [Streptomyces phage Circinus]